MKEEKIELAGLRFSSNRACGGEGEIQILAEDIKQEEMQDDRENHPHRPD